LLVCSFRVQISSDVNKDFSHKDQDQDQDKDLWIKDQDKDKDLWIKDQDKDLWIKDQGKDKDLWIKDQDQDKDLWIKDKDKDLWIKEQNQDKDKDSKKFTVKDKDFCTFTKQWTNTRATWPMLYQTSDRLSSVAIASARIKQLNVMSYCWA